MRTKLFTLLVAILTIFSVKTNATTITVGATGDYASIAAAIAGVGTIAEPLVIELKSDYAETADSILTIAGANATNTVTIRPQTALVVAGTGAFVWKMKGCQYVTVDGRVGGVGASVLTLRADTLVGTSTTTALKKTIALQFVDDASFNTIQYVSLKGATTLGFWRVGSTSPVDRGTITFGAGIATGNSNNTIDNCDLGPIHPYSGAPSTAIYSAGTSGFPNTNLVISNNNIYDYYATDLNKASGAGIQVGSGVGVLLGANTTACTVSGNSFYQTLQRTAYGNANGAKTGAIIIDNTATGSGFIVKNNYIGGSQPLCGGTEYVNDIRNNTAFTGIYISASTTGTSAIYGNTLKNLMILAHSPVAQTYQGAIIAVNGGAVLVGIMEDGTTAAGNNIGDFSETTVGASASIKFVGTNNNSSFTGILFNSLASSNVKISNNKIGGVTVNLFKDYATIRTVSFVGINVIGTIATTLAIENNEIGNGAIGVSPTSMSIQNYMSRSNYGVLFNTALPVGTSLLINNNKINNMYNAQQTTTQTYGNGIWVNTAVLCPLTISNNEIRDLAFTNGRGNDTPLNWASGIMCASQGNGTVINNNTVCNISGIDAVSTNAVGINLQATASTAVMNVYNNKIYNISSNVTRKLGQYATGCTGIFTLAAGAVTPTFNVYNNMIRLGYDRAGNELTSFTTLVGIRDSLVSTGAATANYYHNSIYIGGANVAVNDTVPTFGMCFATSATSGAVRNVKNNLVVNARSNAAAALSSHYAIATGSPNALANFTANNNDYYVNGTGGILGRFINKTDAPALLDVQSYTGDANSKNVAPIFVNATAATADLHLNQTTPPNSYLNAGAVLSIITDFDGDSRAGTPTIGADEYTGPGTAVSNPSNLDINVYANDYNLTVVGVTAGDVITVYSVNGQKMMHQMATGNSFTTPMSKGVYIVNVQTAKGKMNIKTIMK